MTLDTIAIEKEPLKTLVRKNVRSEVLPYFENSVPRDKPKRCGTIRLNFRHVNTLFREKKQQQQQQRDNQKCCGKVEPILGDPGVVSWVGENWRRKFSGISRRAPRNILVTPFS